MRTKRWKYEVETQGGNTYNFVPKSQFASLSPKLLGLGDIHKPPTSFNALAAMLDLEGFTRFCTNVQSDAEIHQFVIQFIDWFFKGLAILSAADGRPAKHNPKRERTVVWGSLPVYAKFTGDGVLLLWNTDHSVGPIGIGNIISMLGYLCRRYKHEFPRQPGMPENLRVGMCRGPVMTIGEGGQDYVGHCINVAARLQKLRSLPLAIHGHGIDPAVSFRPSNLRNIISVKTKVRGVGEETVLILKSDYDLLPPEEKNAIEIVETFNIHADDIKSL